MQAQVLTTRLDVLNASNRSGYFAVQAGTEAYFPVMAFIESGNARFEGESFPESGRVVIVSFGGATVVGSPERRGVPPHPSTYAHETSYKRARRNPEPSAGPSQTRSITIGREFFVTALKDYKDWPIKWWREAVQNAVDANGLNIALGSEINPDGTVTAWCDDDGRGMDEDTILNKFLVLGGTTKIEGTTAGGFGKAKELLLLPWISWRIHSRSTLIEGAGIDYTATQTAARVGTRLTVTMPADKYTDAAVALGFLQKCYLPNVHFTVNGAPARADLVGDRLVASAPDKADIYFVPMKAKETQSYLYVRTKGLFMFERYIGTVPGFVIAELTAPSIEILTANRDGFRDWQVGNTVDQLAERIAKDNMSALKAAAGLIRKKYEGTGKFQARDRAAELLERIGPISQPSALSEGDTQAITATLSEYARKEEERAASTNAFASMPSRNTAMAMLDQKFLGPDHVEAAMKQLVWAPDFYLMNDIDDYKVPKKFFPETMTPTVLKLAKVWAELCRYVLIQLGSESHFGVGFYFSTDVAAAAVAEEGEKWLMLNPHKDMYNRDVIWRPSDPADLKWLYAAAIHEATHIADRISYHDEAFASALTRNMAKCADGYRKIKQIVAGIKMRGGPELEGVEPRSVEPRGPRSPKSGSLAEKLIDKLLTGHPDKTEVIRDYEVEALLPPGDPGGRLHTSKHWENLAVALRAKGWVISSDDSYFWYDPRLA